MGKLAFNADYYFNHQKKIDDTAEMLGTEACPVDMNAGYVAEKADKWGTDDETGEETQENIQQRFSLESPDMGDEDDKY